MRIQRFDRQEFLARRFRYYPGEHLGMWEPTQGGKTHFMYQLAEVAMRQNPHLRVVSAMPKSRSPATRRWAEHLDLKIIDRWPPPVSLGKPAGYVLWPRHLKGAEVPVNRAHLTSHFRRMLASQYQEGDSLTMADDVYILAVLLGLNMDCEEFWTAGSEGGAGLWAPNQKPSGTIGGGSVSSFSYNSPTHLIFGPDSDVRNQKRFSEIGGGVDPQLIASIVPALGKHRIGTKNITDKLYVHKGGPWMCIIGP